MKKFYFFFILFAVTLISCDFMDDAPSVPSAPIVTPCSKSAMYVNAQQYNQTDTLNYTVTNLVLSGNCLEVTISSSGCNPDNWDMNLFAIQSPLAVYPHLVHARVQLINNEACLAVFQKTVSFDLSTIQLPGNELHIGLDGWNTPISYQY